MQPSEGQLHLGLHTGRARDMPFRHLLAQVIQQRCLADAGLAAHDQSATLTRSDRLDQRVKRPALVASVTQNLRHHQLAGWMTTNMKYATSSREIHDAKAPSPGREPHAKGRPGAGVLGSVGRIYLGDDALIVDVFQVRRVVDAGRRGTLRVGRAARAYHLEASRPALRIYGVPSIATPQSGPATSRPSLLLVAMVMTGVRQK
jgi:hypothetical protein